eukprot:scaffold29066_cov48-Phaeocystis_antarctica.AAC.1
MPSGSQGLCRPVQWRSLAASSAAGFRLGTRPRPSRFQLGGSDDHRPCSARCSGGCEPRKSVKSIAAYVHHAERLTGLAYVTHSLTCEPSAHSPSAEAPP